MIALHLLFCLLASASAYSKGTRDQRCSHGVCVSAQDSKEWQRVRSALNEGDFSSLFDVEGSGYSSNGNYTGNYEYSSGNKGNFSEAFETVVEDLGGNTFKGTTTHLVLIQGSYTTAYDQATYLTVTSNYTVADNLVVWQQEGEGKFYMKDAHGQYSEVADVTVTGSGIVRTLSQKDSTMLMENTQVISAGDFSSVAKASFNLAIEVGAEDSKVTGTQTMTSKTGSSGWVLLSEIEQTQPLPMHDGPFEVVATGVMQDPSGLSTMKSKGSGYMWYPEAPSDVKEWIGHHVALSLRNTGFVF